MTGLLLASTTLSTPATAGWFDNLFAAEGGLGSLLSLAKSTLGGDDFGSIANAIPGIDSLLSAAPALDNGSGMSGLLAKLVIWAARFEAALKFLTPSKSLGFQKNSQSLCSKSLKAT
ncbi:hypothetical protein KT99_02557 [Shewanella benthica KT99]|uniref:Uncharacterized protein n=1 Tax=Shewanella benthica KT99 TaxID=314608 RepID=A9CXX8_9GAMM|nr:hypothetical protein KT99_02557 [Shewanella benthica KT99]